MKKFLKKLSEKKGMGTLEFVICLMLFLIIFTFLADMFLILYKQYVTTSACSEIVRQIGIQGGISPQCPENYPGLEKNYLTYNELNNWIKDLNDSFFVEDDSIYCEIAYYEDPTNPNSKKIINPKNSVDTIYLPYGSYISVTVYYPQTWSFWASLTGGLLHGSTFSVTKEFVTDYVSWTDDGYTQSY